MVALTKKAGSSKVHGMDADHLVMILSFLKYGGIAVALLSGVLGTLTRTHEEKSRGKRRLTRWGKVSVVLTVLGCLVAACAQCFTDARQRLQEATSRKQAQGLMDRVEEQKQMIARSELEFREKIQAVLVQLNAAKHEDSRKI